MPQPSSSEHDATCTYCSCLCDDIRLHVQSDQIVAADRACPLGERWFFSHNAPADEPVCRIDGEPAELAAGIRRAAELLQAARSPLIYGLSTASCEAQRMAVAIADRLGATIDTASSELPGPVGLSFHGVGEVTCTLGEIRNRGDLVIFWRGNPVVTHPRHLERYSLLPEGMLVPRGRADRVCIVLDEQPTATSALADEFVPLEPERDFETLWTLRAIVRGLELDADRVLRETGTPLATWQHLVERMQAARFGVLLFGDELARSPGGYLNIDALFALTRDLNAATRFICQPLRSGQNIAGADQVLTWQTGFPFAVNFARGYPRSGTQWSARQMLARGQIDALLLVGDDPASEWPPAITARLTEIPTIVIASEPTAAARDASISIRTAPYSLSGSGTIHRQDDIAIPLRSALPSACPADLAVLQSLLAELQQHATSG
ncbi:MAG TPA: formylmethanofuran dehydrogenase subunit B [Pirellulales bacterium]|nr:formylmethanofuran dehydrogenase subunit B [Pirellulales bacterium]